MMPTPLIWMMVVAIAVSHQSVVFGADVGVNYGRLGNNLPPPKRVIEFLAKDLNYAIPLVRLFEPEPEALSTLATTNLIVTLGVPDGDVPQIASSLEFAENWLKTKVTAYNGLKIRYLTVGNEIIPGQLANHVLPAMKNLHQAVVKANLANIKVSTAVHQVVLGKSYPPSAGEFAAEVAEIMNGISNFLYSTGSPLLINVYPYFAVAAEPDKISLDYALFKSQQPVVTDGNLKYFNLFDAVVDSFVAAMARAVGKEDVKIVVSETGWPTAGKEPSTSIENAQTYNNNLKKHIKTVGGTPRRPDLNLETYIFALFQENLKPNVVEQNWGTLHPDLTPVYPLWT